jgi:hypothetical protein
MFGVLWVLVCYSPVSQLSRRRQSAPRPRKTLLVLKADQNSELRREGKLKQGELVVCYWQPSDQVLVQSLRKGDSTQNAHLLLPAGHGTKTCYLCSDNCLADLTSPFPLNEQARVTQCAATYRRFAQ